MYTIMFAFIRCGYCFAESLVPPKLLAICIYLLHHSFVGFFHIQFVNC